MGGTLTDTMMNTDVPRARPHKYCSKCVLEDGKIVLYIMYCNLCWNDHDLIQAGKS